MKDYRVIRCRILLATFVAAAWVVTAWTASAGPAPGNDTFANRISLVLSNVVPSVVSSNLVTGRNTFATKQSGEPDHAGNVGGKSVWWTWTAPLNGDVRLTTDGSDFDTLLALYTGNSIANLSLVAGSDDHGVWVTSRVRIRATAGTTYQIAVDGYGDVGVEAESGNIRLLLEFIGDPVPRPTNDDFASGSPLPGGVVSVTNSNQNATHEAGEALHAGESGDTSIWWRWTAPESGLLELNTVGSSFDTLLAVYRGDVLTNLIVEASNDDFNSTNGVLSSRVTIATVAGVTYRIAVDGYDGAAGTVVLNLAFASPRLSSPALLEDGRFRFTLNSLPGTTNDILASTDLSSWTNILTVVSTNGSDVITDSEAAGFGRRHYRALLRP